MGHLNFFPNHTGAISRAKMAAPVRANIRMSRLETPPSLRKIEFVDTPTVLAKQRPLSSAVLIYPMHPAVLSLARRASLAG